MARNIIIGAGCNKDCLYSSVVTRPLTGSEAVGLARVAFGMGIDRVDDEDDLIVLGAPDTGWRVPLHVANPDALTGVEGTINKKRLSRMPAFQFECGEQVTCPYSNQLSEFAAQMISHLAPRELPPPGE